MNRRLPDTAWLTTGALAHLLAVLGHAGEEARVVGGAVRDALFGQAPQDVDIATTAVPDTVIERTRAAGFKAVPTGIDHGTVTVIVDGTPFEVTTLRADVETFGRKAKVAFGRDWKVDAERRDFTMNALSVDRAGEIFDYVGGLADIDARRVRFIGDPAKRIAEDYLRILRFFRFHATYGHGAPDPAGACGLHCGARGPRAALARADPDGDPQAVACRPCGADARRHDGDRAARTGVCRRAAAGELREHLQGRSGRPASEPTRCAGSARSRSRSRKTPSGFGSGCGSPIRSMCGSRRSPKAGRGSLPRTARRRRASCSTGSGPTAIVDRVLVAWARSPAGAADADWKSLATLPARWSAPKFPLKAKDFIKRGVAKGPRLGAALAAAEQAWIAAGFPADQKTLAVLADAALAAAGAGDGP